MLRWLKNNHQSVTAVGAMLVGLAALFVAWDQARVMRAQQHGAVVPAVQIDAFLSNAEEQFSMGIRVANNGVGPAFVENVTVLRNGAPVSSLDPMFRDFPMTTSDRSWTHLTRRVLAPGEMVTPLSMSWSRDVVGSDQMAHLVAEWSHWEIEVCYCSVFERCWIATVATPNRAPVEQCPKPTEDIFEAFGLSGPALDNTP